jgi:uncharacterized protein (DUF433 family)
MVKLISKEHIEISPDVRGGKSCIVGTRIAVEDIAALHLKMGQSLIEIAGKYNLSLSSVYAAMAYYLDHRQEIDCRSEIEDQQVELLKLRHSSKLQAKLKHLHGE